MEDEARERREAELCLIEAAYTPQEAYYSVIDRDIDDEQGDDCESTNEVSRHHHAYEETTIVVHRKLPLHYCSHNTDTEKSTGTVLGLDISIALPPQYPLDSTPVIIDGCWDETRLDADATNNDSLQYDDGTTCTLTCTSSCNNNNNNAPPAVSKYVIQKLAHNLLPDLLQQLRAEACTAVGMQSEVIFTLFACIQEWMDQTWCSECEALRAAFIEENQKQKQLTKSNAKYNIDNKQQVLGRRLIYSHHLIASSKRKDIIQIARERRLGGYSKIGWPGIIIIEGEEGDCAGFTDDMRSMRWQYLTVRGEQQVDVPEGEDLDSYRAFSLKFEEMGRDDMSVLAQRCRDVGLESLFRTCMKVYENEEGIGDEEGGKGKGDNSGNKNC